MVQNEEAKPELTEKQKRKIEKDLRRKKFSDIVIQGTNDYSIVSKRSVEKLYTSVLNKSAHGQSPPEYFKHFVKKFQRRSPTINRGYWTRMESIKQSTFKIIQNALSQEKKVVIINLGAGYDPLAFQYLDPQNPENSKHLGKLSFVDVDYPDLNKIKTQMIDNSNELKEIIGEKIPSSIEGVELKTKNYTVLSCDLKNIDLFLKQLRSLDLDSENVTKIFIAEVSIAYMLPKFADPVISTTSKLPDSHFLCLEQLLPAGEYQGFGRTMLFHFSKLNSPLNSVSTYPTIPLQIERFKSCGYPAAEATDLMGFWNSLSKELRKRVEEIEAFDEMEEFIHFAQHYIILHATNSNFTLLDKNTQVPFKAEKSELHLDFKLQDRIPNLERKFPAATVSKDGTILLNGGASISRLKSTMVGSKLENSWEIDDTQLSPRMAHSLDQLEDGSYLLVGGRHAPNRPLSDCSVLKEHDGSFKWIESPALPEPRSRHSTFIDQNKLFVYGGNFSASPFLKFHNNKWQAMTTLGEIDSKTSSAVAYNGTKGVIIGGMDGDYNITDTLHVFEIQGNTINTEFCIQHPLLSRYGAKVQFISDDVLLLIGGVSDMMLHNQGTTIVEIILSTKEVKAVEISNEVWERLPLLVGFELLKYEDSLVCIGGGEVCYSFGSIWNDILVLGKSKVPTFKLQNT